MIESLSAKYVFHDKYVLAIMAVLQAFFYFAFVRGPQPYPFITKLVAGLVSVMGFASLVVNQAWWLGVLVFDLCWVFICVKSVSPIEIWRDLRSQLIFSLLLMIAYCCRSLMGLSQIGEIPIDSVIVGLYFLKMLMFPLVFYGMGPDRSRDLLTATFFWLQGRFALLYPLCTYVSSLQSTWVSFFLMLVLLNLFLLMFYIRVSLVLKSSFFCFLRIESSLLGMILLLNRVFDQDITLLVILMSTLLCFILGWLINFCEHRLSHCQFSDLGRHKLSWGSLSVKMILLTVLSVWFFGAALLIFLFSRTQSITLLALFSAMITILTGFLLIGRLYSRSSDN